MSRRNLPDGIRSYAEERFAVPDGWTAVDQESTAFEKIDGRHKMRARRGHTYDDWSYTVTGGGLERGGIASSRLAAMRKAELDVRLFDRRMAEQEGASSE